MKRTAILQQFWAFSSRNCTYNNHSSVVKLAAAQYPTRYLSSSIPARSRVGRAPLKLPTDVRFLLTDYDPITSPPPPSHPKSRQQLTVTGPRGSLSMPLDPFINIELKYALAPTPINSKTSEGPSSAEAAAADPITVTVSVVDPEDKKQRAMWGTSRALIRNMVEGVTEGFTILVKLVGVGYRATLEGRAPAAAAPAAGGKGGKQAAAAPNSSSIGGGTAVISLKLGHSHPIVMKVPEGVEVKIPSPQRLVLVGNDLPLITQFAAKIRAHRPPEPYNQKGVFVGNETIRKKEGKKR